MDCAPCLFESFSAIERADKIGHQLHFIKNDGLGVGDHGKLHGTDARGTEINGEIHLLAKKATQTRLESLPFLHQTPAPVNTRSGSNMSGVGVHNLGNVEQGKYVQECGCERQHCCGPVETCHSRGLQVKSWALLDILFRLL